MIPKALTIFFEKDVDAELIGADYVADGTGTGKVMLTYLAECKNLSDKDLQDFETVTQQVLQDYADKTDTELLRSHSVRITGSGSGSGEKDDYEDEDNDFDVMWGLDLDLNL